MIDELEFDQSQERVSPDLKELLHPRQLPEVGFQSYNELKNNAIELKAGFLAGEYRNPKFEYPRFYDLTTMDKGIMALMNASAEVDRLETDSNRSAIIKSTLEFRIAEMEFVKTLSRLDYVCKESSDESDVLELLEQSRALNEKLYGVPKPEIVDAAKQALWSNIESKSLSASARKIYDELSEGFLFQDTYIAPLSHPTDADARLPKFNDDSLAWAGEHVLEANADIEKLVRIYWNEKQSEYGDDYVCTPSDIVEAFETILSLLDPEGTSDIQIIMDPDATALQWDSSVMSVIVGGNRVPIKTHDELFQKILHELVVHGGRSISGLKTSLPVLGTGLFTDTPRPDYLTFEEGFATTVEEVIKGEEPKWDGPKLGHYLSIAMAQEGNDFRSVFEKTWRYRLLMKIQDDAEVTEEMINSVKSVSYTACVRVFRGTQTDIADIAPGAKPLTYNKDLAYLEGRIIAMNHIADLYAKRDSKGLDRLFKAKYDPTNPVQNELVLAEFPD